MTHFYSQFCTTTSGITAEEQVWLGEVLGARSPGVYHNAKVTDQDLECWPGFDWSLRRPHPPDKPYVTLWAEESFDEEKIERIFSAFLRQFRPDDYICFTYADTCSKRVPEGFSGGGIIVGAAISIMQSAQAWVDETWTKLKDPWQDDHLQFARLLAAIHVMDLTEEQMQKLSAAMDLLPDKIKELFGRAAKAVEERSNQ